MSTIEDDMTSDGEDNSSVSSGEMEEQIENSQINSLELTDAEKLHRL